MREPNLSFPSQSRAAVCITSALYDRRALDCTATLPLVNSLTHLAYLTSTSPRIREILCLDGGLERLVRILFQTSSRADRLTLWKWTLAFQSIVNVGVRGTEQIRTKVVDAGVIPFVLNILENFFKSFELANGKKDFKKDSISTSSSSSTTAGLLNKGLLDSATTATATGSNNNGIMNTTSNPSTHMHITSLNNHANTIKSNSSSHTISHTHKPTIPCRSTFPYVKIDPAQRRYRRIHKDRQDVKYPAELENVFHREEDVLLCLQLLAYLSKYPHIRDLFHTAYEKNVFSVVEKFCYRLQTGPIQYWAGVIMRNACRKDETRGGIRRCANMACGKWEAQPREFAKCRRCRKAKYCSKACQSKAWSDGHRWWCIERHSSMATATTTATASSTVASTRIGIDHNGTITGATANNNVMTTTVFPMALNGATAGSVPGPTRRSSNANTVNDTTTTMTALTASNTGSSSSSSSNNNNELATVIEQNTSDNAESSADNRTTMLMEMGL